MKWIKIISYISYCLYYKHMLITTNMIQLITIVPIVIILI
jgi:hypothetical protein